MYNNSNAPSLLRLIEVVEFANANGDEKAAEAYSFKTTDTIRRYRDHLAKFDPDHELVKSNVSYMKQRQRLMDTNRIERKAFREHARVENAVEAYSNEIVNLLKARSLSPLTQTHTLDSSGAGIFHLSDLHLNELVNLSINKYDFKVAAQRLQMYVEISRQFFKTFGVKNVLMAITGDLMNSDRRLDELLSQAANRSRATFIGVDLLKSVILDLNKDFNLSVACVSGNESRVKKDHSWNKGLATDNYDFMIFNMLRYLFEGSTGVRFHEMRDPVEDIISVGGKTILIVHGEQLAGGDVEKKVIQLCGKYAARGINIDYVLFGHLHYARVGDHFARSASLVGANDYSDRGLQLITKASQNCHVVTNNGQIHSLKVDLQDASRYQGYNYDESLENDSYAPKSQSKLHKQTVTFEVVI